MGLYNDKEPTVWMESLRDHTYEGKPQPVGAVYLAHEEMVETIEVALKFAKRVPSPPRAVRKSDVETKPTAPAPVGTPVAPMTTETAQPISARKKRP